MKKHNTAKNKLTIYALSVVIPLLIIAGCNNMTDADNAGDLELQVSQSETANLTESANLDSNDNLIPICHYTADPAIGHIKIYVNPASYEDESGVGHYGHEDDYYYEGNEPCAGPNIGNPDIGPPKHEQPRRPILKEPGQKN